MKNRKKLIQRKNTQRRDGQRSPKTTGKQNTNKLQSPLLNTLPAPMPRRNAKRKPNTEAIRDNTGWPMMRRAMQAEELFEIEYRNKMEQKNKEHIRVGVINARTFLFEEQTPEKYDTILDHIIPSDFDILGIGEINKNWTNVQESKQLKQTAKKWWKNSSTNCTWL